MKTIADYLASQRNAIDKALLTIQTLTLTSEPKVQGTSFAKMGIYIDYCRSNICFTHEPASVSSTRFDDNIHLMQLEETRTDMLLPPTHIKYVLDALNIQHSYTLDLSTFKAEIDSSGELEINTNETGHTLDTPMWVLREEYRLRTKRYNPIPEAALSILTNEQRKALSDVFTHCSKTPGLLAYTASPEKGELDIQTPIKPGRLLKKLCPSVSNELIREFASHFVDISDAHLEVTRNFAEVYTERNLSCMSSYFDELDHHPTDAYNHPDNNIILLVVRDRTGTLLGRTLANSKTKQFVNIYFNHEVANAELITRKLVESAGYAEDLSCLLWEKLQLLTSDGRIICPYIDGRNGVTVHDDYLVIGGTHRPDPMYGTLE